MKISMRCCAALLGAVLFGPTGNQAQVILNGDFQTPALAPTGGLSWITLNAGSTQLPGWTIGGQGVDLFRNDDASIHATGQGIDLNSSAAGSISQSIPTTSGDMYRITFQYATGYLAPNQAFRILWNSTVAFQKFQQPGEFSFDWQTGDIDVQGTGLDTLSFESLSAGSASYWVDNVSLAAIPEPEESALLFAGCACAVVIARSSALRNLARF